MTEKVELSSEMRSFVQMEQPGALIQLAELYSRILTQSGATLENKGYRSFSALLFDLLPGACDTQGLIQIIRNLSAIFPHLDDRHIIASQSRSLSSSTESMIELPFYTSLRRLLYDICQRFDERNPSGVRGITGDGLNHLAGAPNIRTINSLLQLGILNSAEAGAHLDSSSDRVAYEVAVRASAVYACQLLAESISEKYPDVEGVTSLSLSIYLDKFDEGIENDKVFIPQVTGILW
jgi:hypothetical protein